MTGRCASLIGLAVGLSLGSASFAADPNVEFFEAKVRPVLVAHCYECHGADKQKGGLRLDTKDATLKGGDSGPALVPGKPDDSRLILAVRYKDEDLRMPPNKRLKPEQVADLEQWVRMGAFDPRQSATKVVDADWDTVVRERQKWWSLQPIRRPAVPAVVEPEWSANPVDAFIAKQLASAKLRPAPVADRIVLARRLSYVLTGLPPTPEQVKVFAADASPIATEKYVDALMASPHFGERWARHWMDVVRYGDTYGYEWDIPAKGAWRYRDYLIRAFNDDVPFDQLIREQLAGDLLAKPRTNAKEQINESLIGPMFYQLGEKRHGDSAMFNGIHQEMVHGKIDGFSRAFQAMTVGCAQCHDHKLDAVSQKDYYALAGMFMSPRWVSTTLDTPERNRATLDKLREIKRELRKELATWWLAEGKFNVWENDLANEKALLPVEDPLHVWQRLSKAVVDKQDVAETWKLLAKEYETLGRQRSEANAKTFLPLADFTKGVPAGWSVEGVGFRDGPVRDGEFTVALSGGRVVGRIMPAGLFSDVLSPRLNGVVRSPFLRTVGPASVSLQVAGGDFSAERTIVDNAFIAERQSYIASDDLKWQSRPTFHDLKGRRVYLEYATKSSNPNFPPRVGLGGACSEEQVAQPQSWLGIAKVVAHDTPGPPADELKRFRSLFEGDAPRSKEEAARRYSHWFHSAVLAWAYDKADEGHVTLLNWMLRHKMLPNGEGSKPPAKIAELLAAYRAAEKQLLDPQTVNGMADIDPAEDYPLHIRGDFDRPANAVPRGYLQIFAGSAVVTGPASGRRELAEFVASAKNPLTARVYVNRVWHWLYGSGLVATPDDFGHLGELPSHPELLDYLATWFMDNGWSTKKLIRLLVLSRTFRQSGQADDAALRVDPRNRLWHHYPLRRLEAEAVRDAMLAVSGRLDPTLFGAPVNPTRAQEDSQKRLFSGPVDGNGRRSIYTKVTLMEPPKFLAEFNQPPPKIPTGRRDVTNVPAQALALLNDPFVLGQADHWGKTLAATAHRSVEERIASMFERSVGRPPNEAEAKRWVALIAGLALDHGVSPGEVLGSAAVWKDAAHAMFNTKEFIYLR